MTSTSTEICKEVTFEIYASSEEAAIKRARLLNMIYADMTETEAITAYDFLEGCSDDMRREFLAVLRNKKTIERIQSIFNNKIVQGIGRRIGKIFMTKKMKQQLENLEGTEKPNTTLWSKITGGKRHEKEED